MRERSVAPPTVAALRAMDLEWDKGMKASGGRGEYSLPGPPVFLRWREAGITRDRQGRFGLAEAELDGNGGDYFWHFGQNTLVRPATISDCNFAPHFTHFSPALP